MTARMRRTTLAEAQREVGRAMFGFGGGLWEDVPLRETGAMNSDGITGMVECHNFIPSDRNLRSRPAPRQAAGVLPSGVVAISFDNPLFGVCVTATREIWITRTTGTMWIQQDAVGAGMDATANTANPLTASAVTISSWATGYVIEWGAVGSMQGYRGQVSRWVDQFGSVGYETGAVYFDESKLKQSPIPASHADNTAVFSADARTTSFVYDYLFTFVKRDTRGEVTPGIGLRASPALILRESGTMDASHVDYLQSNAQSTFHILRQEPLRVCYTKEITPTAPAQFYIGRWTNPSLTCQPPVTINYTSCNLPSGYDGIAVYRTMQKNPNLADGPGAAAAERGGYANQEFRLVGVYYVDSSASSDVIDVSMSDEELASRPLLTMRDYLPYAPSASCCMGTGFYLAYDSANQAIKYTDTGTHPGGIGWHLPGVQHIDMEQPVNAMVASKQSAFAVGNSMTWQLHLDSAQQVPSAVPGRIAFQITSWRTDRTMGVSPRDSMSLNCTEDGTVFAICSDGSLRYHMGDTWSEDIAKFKISRTLANASQTVTQSDPAGMALVHVKSQAGSWTTYRIQAKGKGQGAFCTLGGSDWKWGGAIKSRWIPAGHPWALQNLHGFGGLPQITGTTLAVYAEALPLDQYKCESPVWFKTGVFTGEKMSHFTQHLESHIITEPIPGAENLPTAFTASLEAWGAGLESQINDNRAEARQSVMDFQDAEDVVFPKYMGVYKGYSLRFEWPMGGMQVLQLDSMMKVFDRPVRPAISSSPTNEKLVAGAIMRFNPLHRQGKEVVSGKVTVSGTLAFATGPLDEPGMPSGAVSLAGTASVTAGVQGASRQNVLMSAWIQAVDLVQIGPMFSDPAPITIVPISEAQGNTQITVNGTIAYKFETDAFDGQWHHLAVFRDSAGITYAWFDCTEAEPISISYSAEAKGQCSFTKGAYFDCMEVVMPTSSAEAAKELATWLCQSSREANAG